jgi:hypothetical protein
MNINKIENINVNNDSNSNLHEKELKIQISKKSDNININQHENIIIDKKINNFDKKITNIEIYVKEKIIDLISQIENLRQIFLNTNKLPSFTTNPLFNFPTYNNNTNNAESAPKMKEAHIVEIGGKILPPPTKVAKKYLSNSNNAITAKDKEKDKENANSAMNNKGDINLPKDISHRIKTGKNPTSIKTIINRTLGGNNNTIIFSNMANDFNSKFLKGVEKKTIIDVGPSKGGIENKSNNTNKFIELNKITTNIATKTQNNFKNEFNLLEGDNNKLP